MADLHKPRPSTPKQDAARARNWSILLVRGGLGNIRYALNWFPAEQREALAVELEAIVAELRGVPQ